MPEAVVALRGKPRVPADSLVLAVAPVGVALLDPFVRTVVVRRLTLVIHTVRLRRLLVT